ncbi:MAG: hypothetical protein NZZ41_01360 [Candidatus Dojkabacteria bacterium]|nr:hypothetical protein [Candidatus Dojkabacteria bacterium]
MGGIVFKKKIYKYELGGIITGGVLHSEKNELGDKGIPLIPIGKEKQYNKNLKIAEIEKGEIIIRRRYSEEINRLVDEYEKCKCPIILLQLGKLVKFVVDNLSDKQCDINGVCLLKR